MSHDKFILAHARAAAFQHIDRRARSFTMLKDIPRPSAGWIKAIRSGLGMSLQQLGDKLGISRQSIQQIEQRESRGTITINTLQELASAMDMQLVYGFAPKDNSLKGLVARRSNELAAHLVARSSLSFGPEGSKTADIRRQELTHKISRALQEDMPGILWDKDWDNLPPAEILFPDLCKQLYPHRK